MPAALHCCTQNLILSRLSSAVLADVVTQTPRMALGSQTGAGGVVGGVMTGVVLSPPDFFLQANTETDAIIRKTKNALKLTNFMAENCKANLIKFICKIEIVFNFFN